MRRMKAVSKVLALVCVFALGFVVSSMAITSDMTPEPTVTIDYNVGDDLESMTPSGSTDPLADGATYYVLADESVYNRDNLTTTMPGSAYWEIAVDGSGNRAVEGLYPAPGNLVSVSSPAVFTYAGTNAWVNGYDITFAETALGYPVTPTETTGDTAVLYQSTYYVYTANGWAVAVAKVGDLYYEDFAEAVTAANGGAGDVILLGEVRVSSPISVNTGVDIYCCNDSFITAASGGDFSVSGVVYNSFGSERETIYLTDGGNVDDSGGNVISAALTADSASVTGTNTVLTVQQSLNTQFTVNINGSFADLEGKYFAITNQTVINGTGAQAAYITAGNYPMTIHDGTVYVSYPMDEGKLTITDGELWLGIPDTEATYVTGASPYSGDVHVTSGTAWVLGSVKYIHTYGASAEAVGGTAKLLGTANSARVEGNSVLEIASRDTAVGQVTPGDVTGARLDVGGNSFIQGVLRTNDNNTTYANGWFQRIEGSVTMRSADLSVMDASVLDTVTGNSEYSLEIFGSSTARAQNLAFTGTYRAISIHNIDTTLGVNVTVNDTLNLFYDIEDYVYEASAGVPVMTVENGAYVGALSSMAAGTIEGIINIENSSICGCFTGGDADNGINYAEFHIDERCYLQKTSFVGVMGEYQSLTGRVHTCGDLTVHSTVESTPVYVTTSGARLNAAVITGGMTYSGTEYTDGYECALILDDAKGDTTAELYGGDFQYIKVNDTYTDARVSLTMYDGYNSVIAALPVSIGNLSGGPGCYGTYGLYASGDAATVVTVVTEDIYATYCGVYLAGVEATITGSETDPSLLNTIKVDTDLLSPAGEAGVYVTGSQLIMSNYAITGENSGVTIIGGSEAEMTNVTVTDNRADWLTDTGIGIRLGNGSGDVCSLDLETAAVTGDTGIIVNGGSTLSLSGDITVTGAEFGIKVTDGTVTNAGEVISGGTRFVTATGEELDANSDIFAMYVEKGSVILDGYTFDASDTDYTGSGLVTGNGVVAAVLRDNTAGSSGAYIWGSDVGVNVGSNTTMTVSDYAIFGVDYVNPLDIDPQSVYAGTAGAKVYGELRLSGINTILGGQYGLYSVGGTITNFKAEEAWTTNELIGTAQGSGRILAGTPTSATALRAEGGTVTLGNYDIISVGGSGDSYGLYAADSADVYLCGDPEDAAFYSVTGGTGDGVLVSDATVTVYYMKIGTISADSAQVDSGVLNLGTGVTLAASEAEGSATVRGTDADWAELHVINGNEGIGAQGSFKNLTGYITTTGDLSVIGTNNANAYNATDYTADATILGGGAHDLALGTDKVTAVLADGGTFASVAVTGTSSVQQSVRVLGDLTVTNGDMDYGISATYADVRFIESSTETPYPRSITASNTGASALKALIGAKIYLADSMTFTGNGCGLYLNGNAVVTDMKEDGADLTTYSAAVSETVLPVSSGMITATAGTGVSMDGSSVLLLGNYAVEGYHYALDITGNSSVYMRAGSTSATNYLDAAGSGNTIVNIDTTKQVTLEGYMAKAHDLSACVAVVHVINGTVTLDGGVYNAQLMCPAIVIAADSDGAPNVSLVNDVEVISGVAGAGKACVSVTGADASHKALLTIVDAYIDNAAESGVLIGAYGEVTMSGGSIVGDHLDTSEALYGVRLTAPTSVFTLSGGTIGFKVGIMGDTTGVYAEGCTVTVSGGVIGKYTYTYQETVDSDVITATVYAKTGIYSEDRLFISGGAVYGAENALYQKAGNAWISGGVLDTDNTSEMIDTVILMEGSLWITGGTVNGVVTGENTGNPCLYIKPAGTPTIYAGGDFVSMTGSAKINGINSLRAGNTTDALNVLNEGNYANGTADAYDKLQLTSVSDEAGAVVIENGTAELSGKFAALTVGDGDGAASAEVTLKGAVSLATGGEVEADGVLIIPEDITLTIASPNTLTVGGTLTLNGALDGAVTGSDGILTTANASESGTNVNAQGTFAEITSLNMNNTVTLVGNLTINGTGEASEEGEEAEEAEEAEVPCAFVIGNDAGGLTVADDAVVYAKGGFDFVSGPVVLWGDTTINGSEMATITNTAEDETCVLTVNDTAHVTLQDGSFNELAVNGGTVILASAFRISDVSVTSGSIVMVQKDAAGRLTTNAIVVGSGDTATLKTSNASYLTGTLTVTGDSITSFPAGVSSGTYKGWFVSGGDEDIISDASYGIQDGKTLLIKFAYTFSGGGGSSSYSVDVNMSLADGAAYTGGADQLGSVAVSDNTGAGADVTLTVTPGTSFTVGGVTAQGTGGAILDVTDNGDGTYGFTMPSDNVEISVEFVPLMGEPQTTPEIEYAVLSPQKIYLNGEEIAIMAYNVNGNNYFKLRDIAYFLNGTVSQFAVDFTEDGLVILATGEAYDPVGGEAVLSEDQSGTCVVSAWSLETDGVLRYLKCYNIAGNNFFQLRELGELLGFGVSYDEATNSVLITTA